MNDDFFKKLNLAVTRVTLTDKLFFTKNLVLMLKSGIGITEALESLILQAENEKFRMIISEVVTHVKEGKTMADSLANYPKVFSEIFINMIRAGEESGNLESVLDTLAGQMYKEHDLKSKVKGAVAYPIVILTAMMLIISGLMIFVLPKLTAMFKEGNMELPLPTRILIAVSDFMVHYFYIGIVLIIGVIVGFMQFKKTVIGKKILHKLVLLSPVLGRLAVKFNIARMSRSLASLLKTDIPVVDSFTIASSVLKNHYYRTALQHTAETLKTGATIHETLLTHGKLFPPTIVQMIMVGENTGKLSDMLEEIALFYEEDLDNTLKNLPALLEPILILFLGGTVGGVAVAIMVPVFSLSQSNS